MTAPQLSIAARPHPATAAWAGPLVPPRASEHALFALGTLALHGFLLAQFVSLTRLFWSGRLGDGVSAIASLAGILSVALLLAAVLVYGLRAGHPLGGLVDGARLWVVAVAGLAMALFVYGWQVRGYRIQPVAHDLCPYLVVLGAAVLGSLSRAWADLERPLVALLLAALVVNALGMTEITDVVSEDFAEDRAGISILAYRTQGALAFWPLLFLTARQRRPAAAFLVYVSVFFVLAQQILFQKRGPSVRVLLFVLVFLLVLPRLRRGRAATPATRGWAAFAGAGAVVAAVALGSAPWLFEGQLAGLLQRLSGERYSGGAAAMLTWQNERFFEAGMFLRTLEPQELVLGRGFGGHFVPDTPRWGVYMDDLDSVARRQLHVGGLMPFFKGGLALALVYYAGLVLALARGRRFLDEPLAAAAFFVVLLHAVFLLQEGWFIMSAAFDLVMVGLCMGHLLSRERGAVPRQAPRAWLAARRPA
jgi:hypothetical protein